MFKFLSADSEKVIFLNDKNLDVLKGYKAYAQMSRQGEIHIVLTGLNKKSSKNLFDALEALKPNEILTQ
jgi:hypothetical protein